MAKRDFYKEIFEEFEFVAPYLKKDIVDWYPSGQCEITIKLINGDRVIYDFFDKSFKKVPDFTYKSLVTEKEWKDEFARKLKRRMSAKNITQKELSEMTGITQPALSNYFRGKTAPSGYNISKIARALKCSVSELTEVIDVED